MFVPSYYHILVIVSPHCFASQHQGPTSLPCPALQYLYCTLARHSVSIQLLCSMVVLLCCSSTQLSTHVTNKEFVTLTRQQ